MPSILNKGGWCFKLGHWVNFFYVIYFLPHRWFCCISKLFLFQAPAELGFQDRLSLEGSIVFLDQVKTTDKGVFMIKDMQGFVVSNIHLEVKRKWRTDRRNICIVAGTQQNSLSIVYYVHVEEY